MAEALRGVRNGLEAKLRPQWPVRLVPQSMGAVAWKHVASIGLVPVEGHSVPTRRNDMYKGE